MSNHSVIPERNTIPDAEIEAELDEHIVIDPYVTGTNNRRSDKELAQLLDLIDSLPISDSGKEGDQ